MYIRNNLHIKLHAEDYIRARLMEAENYRMLNQLRKHRRNKILRSFHLLLVRLGRILISFGERLENKTLTSIYCNENG
jgi:hypothetical protein